MLQTTFRGELVLVGAVVEQSVGPSKARIGDMGDATRDEGLRAIMETMSEIIDRLTEENRALRGQTPVPATQQLPPPPSIPLPRPKRTGPQTPHHLPHTNSHALCACSRPIPRNPYYQQQPQSRSPHLVVRRMRDGRRLRGSAKGKGRRRRGGTEGVERMEGSISDVLG